MISVQKKEDGIWLCFKSSKGKQAMVHIDRIVPNDGIIRRAIVETCEEASMADQLIKNPAFIEAKDAGGVALMNSQRAFDLDHLATSKASVLLSIAYYLKALVEKESI